MIGCTLLVATAALGTMAPTAPAVTTPQAAEPAAVPAAEVRPRASAPIIVAANPRAAPPLLRGSQPLGFTPTPPSGEPILLERGRGVLLQAGQPAASFFVADPAVADIQAPSASAFYLLGKAAGETVVYALGREGQTLFSARVRVTLDASGLSETLRRFEPSERVTVVPVGTALALSGRVSSAAAAEDIVHLAQQFVDKEAQVINRLTVSEPAQVQLRVRIAEVDRNALKQIGINWESLVTSGKFAFAAATHNPVTFSDGLVRNIATLGNGDVSATVDALAQNGLITLLAQPNLVAQSGHTASFLAGGEFPIPVAYSQSGATPTITVEFKKFGVSLDFTPIVLDSGAISMRVRPEVSQLSSVGAIQQQGFSIPAITVRRADTTIELGSGETFVIAGLLQRSSEQALSHVPGLGNIPVLGALFRSTRYRNAETELVIIVTPYLVRPIVDPRAAATPIDGLVEPDEGSRLLKGSLYQVHPAPPAAAGGPQK